MESRAHRRSGFLYTPPGPGRSLSEDLLNPCAATGPESCARHDAAAPRVIESHSSTSKYSTSAHQAAPGREAVATFWSSDSGNLRQAENCVLVRVKEQSHLQ